MIFELFAEDQTCNCYRSQPTKRQQIMAALKYFFLKPLHMDANSLKRWW
jgi:hypothetical protein